MASDKTVTNWKAFIYSLPAAPLAALGLPIAVYVPPFYASQLGIDLALTGIIFTIMKFWDVITDPILGVISDRYPSRWGKRRHWLVLSAPILIVTVYFLFLPTPDAGATYLAVTLVIMYIGWTLANISHLSWGSELSPYYEGRSKVQAWREIIVLVGMLSAMALPAAVEQMGPEAFGFQDRGEDTLAFARIASMGWLVLLTLPITIFLAVWYVGEREDAEAHKPADINWKEVLPVLVRNSAIRRIIACDLMSGLSGGTIASLYIFLASKVLMLEDASTLLLFYFGTGLVCLPLLTWVSNRLSKHKTLAYSYIFQFFTTWFILIIPAGNMFLAILVLVLLGTNMGLNAALYRSMMGDVSDDHKVRTGHDQTGVMFSLLSLTNKMGYALALGLTYYALGLIGFNAKGENSPEVLDQIRIIFVAVPTILGGLIAWVIWYYPITPEKQEENRRILEERLSQKLREESSGLR